MDKRIIGPSRPDKPGPYGRIACTPDEPCVYCERDRLRKLVREMGKASNNLIANPYYSTGWITRTQILAEILNHPEVKKILEEEILKDFIGGESIGAKDDDLEVYYPDEEEG